MDGGYGKWGSWSDCSITCGKTKGIRTRYRLCNDPKPSEGGKNCPEDDGADTKTCTPPLKKCPGNNKEI